MKTTRTLCLTALCVGASALIANAQEPGQDRPRGRGGPIMAALDANSDGTIDGDEIAKAAEALKALDKDGDGKLSGEEIRPPRREGGPGGPGGGGARGDKKAEGAQ